MREDALSFWRLIGSRRSIRRFSADPISEADLRRLIEAACHAPSAHNRQPWRFVVVGRGDGRTRLAEAMARRYREDLVADGCPPQEIDARLDRSRQRLTEAAALVILCLTMADMDSYPDARRREAERLMAVQSLALAGGHLLLAAHAEGLGACWMCAPLFVPEVVRDVLDLPRDWEPQGLILLGKPAERPEARGRRPADEVTAWR